MKYSMFAGAAAALVSMVNAYTPATGQLGGNPVVLPNTNSPVTVGEPYTITWDPTTEGTVTLVLLKGPAENILPVYPIAEKIPNNGAYTWTPEASLEGAETGYGIQLIVDATGDYQYTTQFGVVNNGAAPVVDKPVDEAPVDQYPVESAAASSAAPSVPAGSDVPGYTVTYATEYETKTDCDCTETPAPSVVVPPVQVPSGVAHPTGVPPAGVPPVYPPAGVPETPSWNTTTPEIPAGPTATPVVAVPATPSTPGQGQYTGAAGQIKAGGIMMAIVAIAAVAMF